VALLLLVPALLLAQGSQITVTPGAGTRSVDRENVRIDQRLGNPVALDATFRDRKGAEVKFGELLENKPAVVMAIFYQCTGVCNLELRGTIDVLKKLKTHQLGKDFNVIVVGIHPKETPDLAQGKYEATVESLGQPGTESGWKFLVGDEANIRKVTDSLGFKFTYDAAKDAIDHPAGLMFVTPSGRVSSYVYGSTYTSDQLAKNLDVAGREQMGKKVQELFFGCIHVDPITGERSIVIRNVLKVLGVITLIAITLTILTLSGRAQWRRRQATK